MIILDTNIISELMKPYPNEKLISWLDDQASEQIYITSITVAEVMYGLHVLPQGKRRDALELAFQQVLSEGFSDRTLFFDNAAAMTYGRIMGLCQSKGRGMSVCDGQIAAIVAVHKGQLVTRNTKDFEACNIPLINPFE